MLDLSKLHAFVVVAKHESVTKAAEELAISQSPLSRKLNALEDDWGVELFVRERQRIRLSNAGKLALEEAQRLLRIAETTERRIHDLAQGVEGRVVVGYVRGAIDSEVLPRAIRNMRRKTKSAQVELRALGSEAQWHALQEEQIDIGFAYRAPAPETLRNGCKRLVVTERFWLATPTRGPWSCLESTRQLLTHAPFVAGSAEKMRGLIEALNDIGIHPATTTEVPDPTVALALVAAGEGVALVQASLKKRASKDIRFVAMPSRFRARMKIYRLERAGASPLARWIHVPR